MAVKPDPVDRIERALIAIRRDQSRRALLRRSTAPEDATLVGAAFDVLDVIEAAEEAGDAVGVREIAAALAVDQPRASKLVATVVAEGYAARRSDQHDGRRTLLACTDKGRDVLARAHAARRGMVEERTGGWTAGEVAVFAELLGRFVGRG